MQNGKKKAKTKKARVLGAVALKHKTVLTKLRENVGKQGKKPTMRQAMIDVGYSESYADKGEITSTKSFQELMAERIKQEDIVDAELKQMKAAHLGYYYFPKNMSDDDIKEVIESHPGCKFRKAFQTDNAKKVYYHAPDNTAIGKSLDRIYKINKSYDNTITIKGRLEQLSDAEIDERIAEIISGALGSLADQGEKNNA